jgi:hypothetical protein
MNAREDLRPRAGLTEREIDALRDEWTSYRAECFIRIGFDAAWMWSAAHDFECLRAMLHLLDTPGAAVDVGTVAIALKAFDAVHIVPIVRLTALSLRHLQPKANFNLSDRRAELRSLQGRAENSLEALVRARYEVKTPLAILYDQKTH